MKNLIESWKNEKVAHKQLNLNLKQISEEKNYPQHWVHFINLTHKINPKRILDVGCGCGIYYSLCKKNFPNAEYVGVDYSEYMIKLAKKTWGYEEFFVLDYQELTENFLKKFDLIHLGALLDVLPNGDEALNFILSLEPKNIIIGRVKFTELESHSVSYSAYDEIETYAYYHNKQSFLKTCSDFNYEVFNLEDNIYLKKKYDRKMD
jgi:trans-aconitate methyltransferase